MSKDIVVVRKNIGANYIPFSQATYENPLLTSAYDALIEQGQRVGLTDEEGITLRPCEMSGMLDRDLGSRDWIFTLTLANK